MTLKKIKDISGLTDEKKKVYRCLEDLEVACLNDEMLFVTNILKLDYYTDELVEKASRKSPETRSKTSAVKKATKTPKRLTPVVPSVRSTPESANTGEDFLSDYW